MATRSSFFPHSLTFSFASMCFSATASFTASAMLAATGVATIKQKKKKGDFFLSLVPLFFSIQQFIEGLIWLYPNSGLLTQWLGYGFLFFVFFIWPMYIPLAMFKHETDIWRKRFMLIFLLMGTGVSLKLLLVLFSESLSVEIIQNSIQYAFVSSTTMLAFGFYFLSTAGPLLLSSSNFLKIVGAIATLSAWFSWSMYSETFISVWCYFAAVLSFFLFYYFYSLQKQK